MYAIFKEAVKYIDILQIKMHLSDSFFEIIELYLSHIQYNSYRFHEMLVVLL